MPIRVRSGFARFEKIKSSTLTSWVSFYAYIDGQWETIKESEFCNALYTNQFIEDEKASNTHQQVYIRKR